MPLGGPVVMSMYAPLCFDPCPVMVFWEDGEGKCDDAVLVTDSRHHCFKSGNIPKSGGGEVHLNFLTVLGSPINPTNIKRGFVGVKIFYREHALSYPGPLIL